MAEAYIIDAVRTPRGIGKVGKGALAHLHPQHLTATVLKAIADRNHLNTEDVDDVIWSVSVQKETQGGNLGRLSALDAGYSHKASGLTLDRACGGGITSVSLGAAQVMSGMEDLVVAGGTDMLSLQAQIFQREMAHGIALPLGAGNARLQEKQPQSNQGVCADAIASMEGITREDLDQLGYASQQRAAAAIAEGRFDKSVIPVLDDDGNVILDKEEFPRPQTTLEGLAELKPAFAALKDMAADEKGTTYAEIITTKFPGVTIEPVHHAGTSSGVVDGSAAVLLASKRYAQKHGLKPRARIVATANVGDDATLMLNGPVPAAKKALSRAGLSTQDIDLWEINEAFAVVVEKFIRDLDLDRSKVNVNGGSIALGHPVGATGAILVGTVLDELERTGGRFGLVTMCAAGGMAPAIIIERVEDFVD